MSFNIRISKFIYILIMLVLLASCSNRQIYNTIQENRRQECQKLPSSQAEECTERYSMPFDTYQQRQEEANQTGKN